jgi:hypothetical protein
MKRTYENRARTALCRINWLALDWLHTQHFLIVSKKERSATREMI